MAPLVLIPVGRVAVVLHVASRGRKNRSYSVPFLLSLRVQKALMSVNILYIFAVTYDYFLSLLYFSESLGTIMLSVLHLCNFCEEIANIIEFFWEPMNSNEATIKGTG